MDEDRIVLDDPRLNATLTEAMAFVSDLQLRRLGVAVPVLLVRVHAMETWEMQVKINDRLGPPLPLPAPGELGVSATPPQRSSLKASAAGAWSIPSPERT